MVGIRRRSGKRHAFEKGLSWLGSGGVGDSGCVFFDFRIEDANEGGGVLGEQAEQLGAKIKIEAARWAKVVKAAGIKPQ